jgi:serine phosphatase RsbU (regulator of sigma subunit)
MPRIVIDFASDPPATASGPGAALAALDPAELNAWRIAIQRQADREAQLRLLTEIDGQTATIQAATDAATRAAAQARESLRAVQQAEQQHRRQDRQQRMAALARGQSLQFTVQRGSQVIGEINASVDQQRLIETVLSLARRDRGEIPFVLDPSGAVHTVDQDANKAIKALGLDFAALASQKASSTDAVGDWLIVTRRDDSGIVFGLARPMRDSLRDMRRASLSTLAVGLLLIAASFVVIVPLAARLTRHVTTLTDGVRRLARGERGTRVPVESRDEIGDLATAFNAMAAELASHEHMLVQQERLRRELELCRQIQNEMLPHGLLKVGLTEMAGVSIPAREVGGDFFNYFALQDGTIAILVGDVSGKGVGAALLMANVQATLRARLPLEGDLPRLVAQLDQEVSANTPPEVYLTLFVGILDPARKLLRYVNAGHNPQFLLRPGGPIERMGPTGMPVGLMPGYPYGERTIAVGAGELLFLYTDGTVEVFNKAGDMFDADRLEAALIAAANGSINEVLASVEAAVLEFRGAAEPYDDATMMALRISAP